MYASFLRKEHTGARRERRERASERELLQHQRSTRRSARTQTLSHTSARSLPPGIGTVNVEGEREREKQEGRRQPERSISIASRVSLGGVVRAAATGAGGVRAAFEPPPPAAAAAAFKRANQRQSAREQRPLNFSRFPLSLSRSLASPSLLWPLLLRERERERRV